MANEDMKWHFFPCDLNRQQLKHDRMFFRNRTACTWIPVSVSMNEASRTYSTGPQATHTDGSDGWLGRTQPQTETELVICSVVWQSVPPLTLTLYLHAHNDWLCLALALPRFSGSLLVLLFKFWFPTHLSSPPSLSQIRLSRIPDIPAVYVRNSIQLLWARKISTSFPSLYPSPVPDISTRLHLVCTRRGQTDRLSRHDHLHLPSAFRLQPFSEEGVRLQPRDSQRWDLETSFYMYSNGAKSDNAQSSTHKSELIEDCALWPWQGG